jgi:hypothetical protein
VARTVRTSQFRLFCCLLTAVAAAPPLPGADASNLYLSWSGWAEQFADPNTGLTVLNTLLMPMGGNLEGMGTAYTAVADDAGYIEANPAASSQLKLTELSLMHRNWISDVTLESVVYTMRLEDFGFGIAGKFLPIRFTGYDSWGDAQNKAYITESVLIANASYNLLNTYVNNLTFDGVALGANLKLAYRSVPQNLATGQSGLGVMLDLGALTRLNFLKTYLSRSKNFSVGLAIKNLGPYVHGEPLPTMITAGVAYAVVRPVTISLDVNVPVSFQPTVYPAERINVATGIDISVASFLSLQAGLWLRGSNPRATIGATVDLARTSLVVNGSIDRTGVHFSVEGTVNLGDRGRGERQARIDDYFAGAIKAYAAGDYDTAITLCQQVLALREDHRHAQLVLALAQQSKATQEEILRKQKEAAGLLEQATGTGAAATGTDTTGGTPADTSAPAQPAPNEDLNN